MQDSALAPAETTLKIPVGLQSLVGDLVLPDRTRGLILFAHGSGSGRHSSRNRHVAHALQQGGFATLLLDLLTAEEERIDLANARYRFDIGLLAERLEEAARFLKTYPATGGLEIGCFGASTGAAAALITAAEAPGRISAVVSRGGRPDLAGPALPEVKAPTLLIVGGADGIVVTLNEQAYAKLVCEKSLEIVPGATHLFEEPGALDRVAHLASRWFARHLSGGAGRPEDGGAPGGRP